jgi:hypothetical protein
MFFDRLPPDELAPALDIAWTCGHGSVHQACDDEFVDVLDLFRYARFELPSGRGDAGDVADGLSWTLSRDMACWFAVNYSARDAGDPVVLKAVIPSQYVLFYGAETEQKIIADLQMLLCSEVDGNADDWRQRAAIQAKAMGRFNHIGPPD